MDILNNREIATVIWFVAVFGFLIIKANAWDALAGVYRSFFKPLILWPIAMMALWVAASVWVLARHGLWEIENLKTTIIWFVSFAIGWMFNVKRWEGDPNENVRHVLKDVLSLTVIVTFLTEFYTFSLVVELLLVPSVAFITLLAVVAERDEKTQIVGKLGNGLLAVIGFSMLIYAAGRLVADFSGFATPETGREFALPGLLSLLFVPYMYVFSVVMGYSTVFRVMAIPVKDPHVRRYAKWRTPFWFGLDVSLLRRWKAGLFRLDEKTTASLRAAAMELKAARKRERRPPVVPEALGWSPHIAGKWLADHDLKVRAYDPILREWSGSSERRKLKEGIFQDYLSYRVTGTATAATRLTLTLTRDTLRKDDLPDSSVQAFSDAMFRLLLEVFEQDASRVVDGLKSEEHQAVVRGVRAAILDDEWDTKLEITHPAHVETMWGD